MNDISSSLHDLKPVRRSETGNESLLSADEPAAFTCYNEDAPASVLLVADHASAHIPASLEQLGVDDWVLERHVTWDIGSDMLTRHLADLLKAPAILAGFSRLIVDPNRQLDDPSAFPEISDGIAIPGNLELSAKQKTLRTETFFRPYHETITARLDKFEGSGTVPALISVHTCTPVFNRVVRPWQMGIMWDKDPRIAQAMMDKLRQKKDLCFGDNEPYSGRHAHDFTLDFHAEPRRLPHVGIEVRQDLVDETDGALKWAKILAESLEEILLNPNIYSNY